jgi:pyruvate formate lyase activating enzyme
MLGVVTDIQRFSIHDGPGIRTLVFMKGCLLRCPWCSNPETQLASPELMHYAFKCIRCNSCVDACSLNAINLEGKAFIDIERCQLCGDCIAACPSGALKMVGEVMSAEKVCEIINNDRVFYENSGGGATFSGGEPLLQPEFLAEMLCRLQTDGVHTAVETSGSVDWPVIEHLERAIDLFLYDLKILDPERHKETVGVSNRLVVENLKKLASHRDQIIVRIPVIPQLTAFADNIPRIFELLSSLPSIHEVHLLPYHNFGMSKYHYAGRNYVLEALQPPEMSQLNALMDLAKNMGLECSVGG